MFRVSVVPESVYDDMSRLALASFDQGSAAQALDAAVKLATERGTPPLSPLRD